MTPERPSKTIVVKGLVVLQTIIQVHPEGPTDHSGQLAARPGSTPVRLIVLDKFFQDN